MNQLMFKHEPLWGLFLINNFFKFFFRVCYAIFVFVASSSTGGVWCVSDQHRHGWRESKNVAIRYAITFEERSKIMFLLFSRSLVPFSPAQVLGIREKFQTTTFWSWLPGWKMRRRLERMHIEVSCWSTRKGWKKYENRGKTSGGRESKSTKNAFCPCFCLFSNN